MKKLVVLKLDGSFCEGFRVGVEIGEDGSRPVIELSDPQLKLPPIPSLPEFYQNWYNSYRCLDGYRIKPKKNQISHVQFQSLKQECHEKAEIITESFISWLQADSFRVIKEQCLAQLDFADEVRVIIRTTETQLRKLPWHLWDLFDYYPDAEVGLSSLSSQRFKRGDRPHIRILIILGNSEGINVAEDEKLLKQYCQKAETVVLAEPSPEELNEYLWDDQGWDMLFFSGHSRTEEAQGRIFLNRTDSLTMEDLRYGLQTAVRGGLQLAFFNSCDGLGIAASLEDLHIPQVIVMREPVPDRVAHQFLKNFFQEFTQGKSLYQSVNVARKKLQGLEKDYPCATWLPVIIQNLLATPPTWYLGEIAKCPYRGLAAFREEDAVYFYGREAVTQHLVSAVRNKSLIAVVGASGSGKSSVVFAGLVSQLKQDKKHDWLIVSFRPGNNPLQSLAIALTPLLPVVEVPELLRRGHSHQQRLVELELEVELKDSHRALQNFIEPIIAASPKSHIVLIADQFEELYTLCHSIEERNIFLDNLLNAVHNAPAFTLILTLRADFYGEALSYRPFADMLVDGQVNLGAMNTQELQAAIAQPAKTLNVQLEAGLTQRLVDAVLQSPNHLPLLEFTLTQLWEKQHQGWLTHEAYADIGGVETALANHAETIYAQLSAIDKERVQKILIQLVQPGETSRDIRRLATREEVGEENWELVTRLADGRLVVTNRHQRTGVETVEIIHEALIQNWHRLRQWMRVDRDFRRWQEQLRARMRQWENSHEDEGTLLRGRPLIEADEWLLQRSTQISPAEQSFIFLSLALRDREQKEKNAARRRILIGLILGLVGACLLAGFALLEWRQAQVNELKALNLSAKVLLKSGNEIEAFVPAQKSIQTLTQLKTLDRETKIGLLGPVLEVFNQIREYNRLKGHEGSVTSVTFSPNGQFLASGSQDETIKIWRRDGKLIQTLEGHKDGVFSVIFSPDSQNLIAASFDNTITFWRYESATGLFTKNPFFRISESDGLGAIALTPDNKLLATGTENGKVKLWTLDGNLRKTIPAHNKKIWSLNFSPDGKTLATASADRTVKLWNFEGKFLKTLQGHSDEVLSVSFSPDGKTLASASRDKTVRLWDFAGQLLHTFEGHTDEVLDVRFSADGKLIASASADNTVKLWNVQGDWGLRNTYPYSPLPIPYSRQSEVSFSPDGKILASASADGVVKLWRFEGILPNFPGKSLSINPDGKTVAIANQQGIITLRRRDGSLLQSINSHEGEIVKILFSPNGTTFVTISKDNQIKLWNLEGNLLKSWQGHEGVNNSIPHRDSYTETPTISFDPIQDVSFHPDGKTLATIGGIDKKVKLWDLEGNLLTSWETHDGLVTSINFSPDGKTLATSGDKTVKLWNLDGKLRQTLQGHQNNISSVIFSPDGKMIATASDDKTVKLWDGNGKLLRTLDHKDNVYSISFSPDSQLLVSGNKDKTLNIWSVDGKLMYTLEGHQNSISEVHFSTDGNIIASVDVDNNIILWNLDINDLQQRSSYWLHCLFEPCVR
ncbi:MAG: CHAT domain-containing protein [Stigonema ocellatum SAG 48.90 = DSM 106950]|nr:CHAT domain-containing protein [Stigonema ocellatum SAG 48.90 = DSM 106950]